jgi:hypothetical protein
MSKERPFPGLITPESLQAGQEFTDRDPQYPATRITTNYRGEGKLHEQMLRAPLGEPTIDVDVRSVYDVRPIQAFDFNVTLTGTISTTGESAPNFVAPFAVPEGYVAVVRKYNHCTSPIFPATARSDLLLTLQSNNADVPNNVSIPVGADSQDLVICFFIVDEGGTFGARFVTPLVLLSGYPVFVTVYGNFVRKTGRAANLEIGNPIKGANKPMDPAEQPVTWLRKIAGAMGVK